MLNAGRDLAVEGLKQHSAGLLQHHAATTALVAQLLDHLGDLESQDQAVAQQQQVPVAQAPDAVQ